MVGVVVIVLLVVLGEQNRSGRAELPWRGRKTSMPLGRRRADRVGRYLLLHNVQGEGHHSGGGAAEG